MNDLSPSSLQPTSLTLLVRKAASQLASAETAAEVLEARDGASFAYDAAKKSARMAKAKGAHDEIISAVYRTQADALEIEALAKRRLADEYDTAQERGEVAKRGEYDRGANVPDGNISPATVEDIGLTRKQIHEAREIREAEKSDPGVVRRTLDHLIETGQEPTKAAVKREIVNRTSFTGNNQWFTPDFYMEMVRDVLGSIDLDPASHPLAQERICATHFFTEDDDGLSKDWFGKVWLNPPYAQPAIGHFVDKMLMEAASGRIEEAIMLTHNYTDTGWFQKAARAATAICFTKGRIKFVSPDGEVAAPTQGQAFFYFGSDPGIFFDVFRDVGLIVEVRQ
jgi:phage N-6-adenine-methyltransferase